MIVIAALVIGAILGWRRAGRLGGGTKDRAQYAAVFGLIALLLGLFLTIALERMA